MCSCRRSKKVAIFEFNTARMKSDFQVTYPFPHSSNSQFSNLVGTVFKQGNLVFVQDGSALLSPVGNRISHFDLTKYQLSEKSTDIVTNPSHLHLNIEKILHG